MQIVVRSQVVVVERVAKEDVQRFAGGAPVLCALGQVILERSGRDVQTHFELAPGLRAKCHEVKVSQEVATRRYDPGRSLIPKRRATNGEFSDPDVHQPK